MLAALLRDAHHTRAQTLSATLRSMDTCADLHPRGAHTASKTDLQRIDFLKRDGAGGRHTCFPAALEGLVMPNSTHTATPFLWLPEGGAPPSKQLFNDLVGAEDVDGVLVKGFAVLFCEEQFDAFSIYDPSDPHYTLKDLAHSHIVIEYDQEDLMNDAREKCIEARRDYFATTLVSSVVERIERHRSERTTFNLDRAFDQLKEACASELYDWALGVMRDTALRRQSVTDRRQPKEFHSSNDEQPTHN